ncbi:MAG: hypothetical protein C0447_09630 [Methylobacterium sp.]|nr:hypothetical protein [Methylobacterium sp.]
MTTTVKVDLVSTEWTEIANGTTFPEVAILMKTIYPICFHVGTEVPAIDTEAFGTLTTYSQGLNLPQLKSGDKLYARALNSPATIAVVK